MAQLVEKSPIDLVMTARSDVLERAAFFAVLAMRLKLVEASDDECPTMATDGVHIFFSRAFTLRISAAERMGVIVHEALHCAMRHFARRGWRDPELWNIACDLAINPIVLDAGFRLPKGVLFQQRFVGMCAEAIYDVLAKEEKQGQPRPQPEGDGACGEVRDAPSVDVDGNGVDASELEGQWNDTAKIAVGVANRRAKAGQAQAGLEAFKVASAAAQIDWRYELSRFTDFSAYRDNDWTRPNRRFAWQGVNLPSMVPQRPSCVVACYDTSGSMDVDALARINAEMQAALDAGAFDRLVCIYANTSVQCVDEYEPGDTIVVRSSQGTGGTDFIDTFDTIARDYPDASCVVYLTDGGTDHWGTEPACPVLWAMTVPREWLDNIKPPFGEMLPLM